MNHRIEELQTITEEREWRFLPRKENPSDLATRLDLADEYEIPEEWTRGPRFLKRPEEEWQEDLPWALGNEDKRSKKLTVLTARKSEDVIDVEQE